MFKTTTQLTTEFSKIILEDTSINTSVEIVPNCGAILHAFTVINNGKALNIIDSYESESDFKTNVESKGFKSSKLSPFACRIKDATYKFAQNSFVVDKFILNGSALHGLLYNEPFDVTKMQADENSAMVTMQHEYKGANAGFPYAYTCAVTYELKAANALTITTTITNNSEGLMPIQDGWHPYFTFGNCINNLQLEFQSKEKLEFDEGLIPTGKLMPYQEFGALKFIDNEEFDNCFTVNFAECQPLCVLRDKEQKIQLEIYPDKSYPYLQIYTPPHRNSIAIENLSAAPDAFNNGMGLKIMDKGSTEVFTTTFVVGQW